MMAVLRWCVFFSDIIHSLRFGTYIHFYIALSLELDVIRGYRDRRVQDTRVREQR